MNISNEPNGEKQKEYTAELLKERIYATLALLAVLISIDTTHYSPLKAGYLILGTILSLWAASIVAAIMSRRIIYHDTLNPHADSEHQLRKHAPMLASLPFPMLTIALATVGILPLSVAVNISIASVLILMMTWSILSARSLHMSKLPIFILVISELAIGLAVVGLKVVIGH
ncbi:MAG: hypothetical protein JWO55_170 [Candidatus Saccharibacteria bacterium]|jgi:hypothetical protein|nr:hypothetical protein [Candidatus Saccharibacteria bacterium]